ncbi:hypothetical protein TNCV_596941 [Trichonephila clavipes]|nr:hypothetical protein TNCV_596941 [Trichonephila clavipes]
MTKVGATVHGLRGDWYTRASERTSSHVPKRVVSRPDGEPLYVDRDCNSFGTHPYPRDCQRIVCYCAIFAVPRSLDGRNPLCTLRFDHRRQKKTLVQPVIFQPSNTCREDKRVRSLWTPKCLHEASSYCTRRFHRPDCIVISRIRQTTRPQVLHSTRLLPCASLLYEGLVAESFFMTFVGPLEWPHVNNHSLMLSSTLTSVARHGNSIEASPIHSQAPNTEIPPLLRTRSVCRLEVPSFKIPKAAGSKNHISASSPVLKQTTASHRRLSSGY